MGEGKVDVLLRVSRTNLSRAEARLQDGEYDSAVFHASMAVENAVNAMILRIGGSEAKDHRLGACLMGLRLAREGHVNL